MSISVRELLVYPEPVLNTGSEASSGAGFNTGSEVSFGALIFSDDAKTASKMVCSYSCIII